MENHQIINSKTLNARKMKNLIITILLAFISFQFLIAQSLHFIPPFSSDALKDSIGISFVAEKPDTINNISIHNNELLIFFKDGTHDIFDLTNKTVIDICNSINLKYKGKIKAYTNYPSVSATHLDDKKPSVSASNPTIDLKFGASKLNINIDFGVVYSLANGDEKKLSNNSLLNQSGFNLDLIANKHFSTGDNWGFYGALRLGFSSNINQLLTDSTNIGNTGGQIAAAIKQANNSVLSGFTEFAFTPKNKDFQVGLFIEGGLSQFRFKPFDPSEIMIKLKGDTSVLVKDVVSKEAIDRFILESTEAKPIGYGEFGLNFRFIKSAKMVAYGNAGFGWKPDYVRIMKVRFKDDEIDDNFLESILKINWTAKNILPNLLILSKDEVYEAQLRLYEACL
jgi:hypothetical protein